MKKRDYLYAWKDKKEGFFLFSGITFKDVLPSLVHSEGIIPLRHYSRLQLQRFTGLEIVPACDLPKIAKEDIYSWGDFVFVDYTDAHAPRKKDIAEILYFAYTGKLYKRSYIPAFNNTMMYCGHDDGWFLKLYCDDNTATGIITRKLDELGIDGVPRCRAIWKVGCGEAIWVYKGKVVECEKTMDVDSVLNARRR